ncbi:MAG: type II toxin-antitoxin system HicA family toxin [Nanoarchaeota archaeon]
MKLKNIKSKEVIKILEKNGFEIKRQTGTHVILKNNGKMVVVPIHHKTIPTGTLKSIEKQSEINFREIIG